MLILYAILIASVGLVDASAIKGHQRSHEETARSIKLAPAANNLDKSAKSAPQVASAPVVPILESTKKIYNDESIRRLAQQPLAVEPASKPVVAEPVAPVAPVVQQSPPVIKPVVAEPVIPVVPVVAPVASPVVEQPASVPVKEQAVPEPKSAPVEPVVPMAPAAPVKPVEELPPQSDRSAPLRNEVSAAVAPVVEPIVSKPVVEQPAIAQQAPQPAEPAVAEPTVKVLDSPLQAKKDEANAFVPPVLEPLHIEVPAPDPGLVLSEPIDSTTKLLIDLDEHVQKFLPAEEQQQPAQPQKDQALVAGVDYSPAVPVVSAPADPTGKSSGPLVPYSSTGADNEPIVPPLPSLDGVEKASAGQPAVVSAPAQPAAPASSSSSSSAASPSATRQAGHQNHQNQQQVITQLLDQLDTLQNRIQDTINQLVARRRYVMSALLRPMGTYVRRVRTNLERLQNRVNQLQAAAVSVGGGNNRPGGFVDAAAIDTIRRRIDDISKRISDIVNRIRFSLTPTSAPMNSNGRK